MRKKNGKMKFDEENQETRQTEWRRVRNRKNEEELDSGKIQKATDNRKE